MIVQLSNDSMAPSPLALMRTMVWAWTAGALVSSRMAMGMVSRRAAVRGFRRLTIVE